MGERAFLRNREAQDIVHAVRQAPGGIGHTPCVVIDTACHGDADVPAPDISIAAHVQVAAHTGLDRGAGRGDIGLHRVQGRSHIGVGVGHLRLDRIGDVRKGIGKGLLDGSHRIGDCRLHGFQRRGNRRFDRFPARGRIGDYSRPGVSDGVFDDAHGRIH